MKHFVVLLITMGLFVSCSSPSAPRPASAPLSEASFDRGAAKMASEPTPAPAPEGSESYGTTKQVKSGSVILEASDPAAVEAVLVEKLKTVGGYVENSLVTEASRSLTLRIPATVFDPFLEGMTAWGKLVQRQVSVADVTIQYYDLETRLKNQRILLDQYRGFLSQTKKMDEILDAMGKISELTTSIESTEGQFRYLSRQVGFSTLQVELTSPLLSSGRTWPDWDRKVSALAHDLADFGVGTVFFLFWAVVVGPVLFAGVALVIWLFVGRPGLWRRLMGLRQRPVTGFTPPV